jgi:abortive infection bacteriophage resistance protein
LKPSYNKPHLTYQQQIELLEARGLCIANNSYALTKLVHINYFRLSAYYRYFYMDEANVLGKHRFLKGIAPDTPLFAAAGGNNDAREAE